MPSQTCFEKPRSCWYGCLCVCGHGIMISPVIVKCELCSLELCESQITLPHSARSTAKKKSEPSSAHIGDNKADQYLPARNGCSVGLRLVLSQPCCTLAHFSSSVTPPHAFVLSIQPCMLAYMSQMTPMLILLFI